MNVVLADITCVKREWQTVHRIKALEIDGRSPALDALADWSRNNQRDFKRLMRSIKLVCQNKRVLNPKYVKKSNNPKHGDVYEIRADKGLPRLFSFYRQGSDEIVICTHGWGKKSSREQQDAEFAKCSRLKTLYEAHRT